MVPAGGVDLGVIVANNVEPKVLLKTTHISRTTIKLLVLMYALNYIDVHIRESSKSRSKLKLNDGRIILSVQLRDWT